MRCVSNIIYYSYIIYVPVDSNNSVSNMLLLNEESLVGHFLTLCFSVLLDSNNSISNMLLLNSYIRTHAYLFMPVFIGTLLDFMYFLLTLLLDRCITRMVSPKYMNIYNHGYYMHVKAFLYSVLSNVNLELDRTSNSGLHRDIANITYKVNTTILIIIYIYLGIIKLIISIRYYI